MTRLQLRPLSQKIIPMLMGRNIPMRNNIFRPGRALRLAALSVLFISSAGHATELLTINVHRDANCGCCKKWMEHLEATGFTVVDHVETNMSAVKQRLGVAPRLASCHTGVIDGKFVEGHVPAEQVRLLAKRADLKGLAVPGMPMGSPGMGDDPAARYDVIAWGGKAGEGTLFQRVGDPAP